jgi:hypothetical protein
MDWGCDFLAWFVNGQQIWRLNKSEINAWAFNQPFYLLLNLAVGGNWPGNTVDTSGGDLLVDYVRVYTRGGTAMPSPSPAPLPSPGMPPVIVVPSPSPPPAVTSPAPAPPPAAGLAPSPGGLALLLRLSLACQLATTCADLCSPLPTLQCVTPRSSAPAGPTRRRLTRQPATAQPSTPAPLAPSWFLGLSLHASCHLVAPLLPALPLPLSRHHPVQVGTRQCPACTVGFQPCHFVNTRLGQLELRVVSHLSAHSACCFLYCSPSPPTTPGRRQHLWGSCGQPRHAGGTRATHSDGQPGLPATLRELQQHPHPRPHPHATQCSRGPQRPAGKACAHVCLVGVVWMAGLACASFSVHCSGWPCVDSNPALVTPELRWTNIVWSGPANNPTFGEDPVQVCDVNAAEARLPSAALGCQAHQYKNDDAGLTAAADDQMLPLLTPPAFTGRSSLTTSRLGAHPSRPPLPPTAACGFVNLSSPASTMAASSWRPSTSCRCVR